MYDLSCLREKLAYLHEYEDFSKANLPFSKANGNEHLSGSATHRYQLGMPLEETVLQGIQQQYHLSMPEDYRRFLIEVGNGGAGPVWGLFTLEDGIKKAELEAVPDRFKRSFPHTAAWLITDETCLDDDSDQVVGSLPIGNFGCAIEFILVLNGQERGNIWLDNRANCYGVAPLTLINQKIYWPHDAPSGGIHVDFFTWYDTWLDEEIARLNARLGR